MAPKRKREDMDCDPDDQVAVAMEKLAGEWLDWRVLHPRRAPNLTTYLFKRPGKNEQHAWHVYKIPEQTWFMAPFAIPMARGQTQSLACAPPEAELQRYTQTPNEDDF